MTVLPRTDHLRPIALALLAWAPVAAAPAPAGAEGLPPRPAPAVRHVRFVVYDDEAGARAVFRPVPPVAPLTPRRGAHRQEPSRMGVFDGPAGHPYGVGKVPARRLLGRSPAAMARVLRRAVADTCGPFRCLAHQVFVDDLDRRFRGPEGARLSRAMALLGRRSPAGGTWARRVHFYLADETLLGIAGGDRAWEGVLPALARSGGVWLEMYESVAPGVTGPLSGEQWRQAPAGLVRRLTEAGGRVGQVRFMFGGATRMPAGHDMPPGCWTSVRCQWLLAESTATNRAILVNGAGMYRLGAPQARDWLGQLNLRFPPPGSLRFRLRHL